MRTIASNVTNTDGATVRSFGQQWSRSDQTAVSDEELRARFDEYFLIFPWDRLPSDARGADIGCGFGHWPKFMAMRVSKLYCVDASDEALGVAKKDLGAFSNIEFHHANVGALPFEEESLDFVYSLGVLHQLPVVTVDEARPTDVVHAGDVLEHLTDLDYRMPRILSRVKDGSLFLAQGPLEANDDLFTWSVRLARSLSRRKPIEMPPYHVFLATVEGQWALFRRSGLNTIEESVTEVSWPAPARLSSKDLLEARTVWALWVAPRFARSVATETPVRGKSLPLRWTHPGELSVRFLTPLPARELAT